MTRDNDQARLGLPRAADVDVALGLEEADSRGLPGLWRLNAVRLPAARLAGFTVALAVVPFHNAVVLGGVDWGAFLALVLAVEGYCIASWWALARWFDRVSRVHLGTVFVVADLFVMTLLVHATGGPSSLYWPIYFVRVADQMWISQRRAGVMTVLGVALYVALVAAWSLGGYPVAWSLELLKVAILGGLGIVLAAAAGQPWRVRDRTVAARELILELGDLTREIDRQRARAEKASRAKSEFLARMTHELRTPLNSVLGFTNLLLKRRSEIVADPDREYLERIRRNGIHLLALVDDILDLERLEEGTMELRREAVDIGALVRRTVAGMEERARPEVQVAVRVPEPLDRVRADEARLGQVLANLVENALDFTERGSVTVEVVTHGADSGPAAIRVRDTGRGIPRERLPHIFDAFEQGEGGHARSHQGPGLGLAIARALCALMDFELMAESEPGRGSTFTVLLPPDAAIPGDRAGTGREAV